MSNRELVLDLVSQLPEDTSMEDIMEKISFIAGGNGNEAIAQGDRGDGIPIKEVRARSKIWAAKSS